MATKRRRKGNPLEGETAGRLKAPGEEVADAAPAPQESGDAVDDVVQAVADKVRQQKRWARELEAAKKEVEEFHREGEKTIKRFRGKSDKANRGKGGQRNYFAANIQTQEAILYGKTPKIDVERKYSDANDDVARVACTMLERLSNADIHRAHDEYATAVGMSLWDFMVPGLGISRLHYRPTFETVPAEDAKYGPHPDPQQAALGAQAELAPAVPEHEAKTDEDIETEYFNWRDFLWSSGARHWGDVRWGAFRIRLTKGQLKEKFGEKLAATISMNAKKGSEAMGTDADSTKNDPRDLAEIWEIHSKEDKKVFFVQEGADAVLEVMEDPWGIDGFFIFPRPMFANLATDSCVPIADYTLVEQLYDELEFISMRTFRILKVMKAVGVYDSTNAGLKRLLQEAVDNDLLPVEGWAALSEKGGIAGAISMFPVEQYVAVLQALVQRGLEVKQELDELSGFSDVIRGAGDPTETATQSQLKGKYASVRLTRRTSEFARFCTDLARIRIELVSKLYEPECIIDRSNILRTEDGKAPEGMPEGTVPPLVQQAVQLIKSDFGGFRIEVKPESVSIDDFTAARMEATEVLGTLAQFVQSFGPLMQMPGAASVAGPIMQGALLWLLTKMKGGKEIEPYFDEAFAALKQQQQQAAAQPQQPPPPDPKLQAAQVKAQTDIMREKVKTQGELMTIQAQSQADLQHQAQQTRFNVAEAAQKERIRVNAETDRVVNPPGFSG